MFHRAESCLGSTTSSTKPRGLLSPGVGDRTLVDLREVGTTRPTVTIVEGIHLVPTDDILQFDGQNPALVSTGSTGPRGLLSPVDGKRTPERTLEEWG